MKSLTAPAVIFALLSCFSAVYAQETKPDAFEKLRKSFPKMEGMSLDKNKDKPSLLNQGKPGVPEEKQAARAPAVREELPGMSYVPAGDFSMGTNTGFDYEYPEHSVYLDGFYIDKYEVTNAQYKRFIDYTGRKAPEHWKNNACPQGAEYEPVTNVSCVDALEYAKWAGKRLPTEEEWEKAARYTDARTFPWGNEWKKGFANVRPMLGFGSPKQVGSYPDGKSKYEVFDLCGNVWEWTDSNFMPYKGNTEPNDNFGEKNKVIRGGSYRHAETMGQCSRRDFMALNKTRTDVGFRCAR